MKVIKKSGRKEDLLAAVAKILQGDFSGLDVKKLAGRDSSYRCRVGTVRIVFFKREETRYIESVGYRGDIYK